MLVHSGCTPLLLTAAAPGAARKVSCGADAAGVGKALQTPYHIWDRFYLPLAYNTSARLSKYKNISRDSGLFVLADVDSCRHVF